MLKAIEKIFQVMLFHEWWDLRSTSIKLIDMVILTNDNQSFKGIDNDIKVIMGERFSSKLFPTSSRIVLS